MSKQVTTLYEQWVESCLLTHLVIDGVKLGEKDSINGSGILMCLTGISMIYQGPVEFDQLVHSLVSDQSLANKQDQIWTIHPYQLHGGLTAEGRRWEKINMESDWPEMNTPHTSSN